MTLRTQAVDVTVSGSAGSATGSGVTAIPISGIIKAIHLDYTSQPATCDVTVAETAVPAQTILSVSNANSDAWFYPVVGANLSSDGSAITDVYVEIAVKDYLTVSVAQGDAGSVLATIVYED